MRTIADYLDWMREMRQSDPGCVHRMNFETRLGDGLDLPRVDRALRDLVPAEPSVVEYQYAGMRELFELGNAGLYVAADADVMDEILQASGFSPRGVNCRVGVIKSNRRSPAEIDCAAQRYQLNDARGSMDLDLMQSLDAPIVAGRMIPEEELRAEEQRGARGYPLGMELQPVDEGVVPEVALSAVIIFGYAQARAPAEYRYPWNEQTRMSAVLERGAVQPILEAVVTRDIQAILWAKGNRFPHFHLG